MVTGLALLMMGAPLLAGLALAAVCLLWSVRSAPAGDRNPEAGHAPVVTTKAIKGLSRSDIQARLKALSTSPAPKAGPKGAMCYKPAGRPPKSNYVCPRCGEKTLYTTDLAYEVERTIPNCRRSVQELAKLVGDAVVLDESQFCRSCSPDTLTPHLAVVIHYEGTAPHRVTGVNADDLQLLVDFFSTTSIHQEEGPDTSPLKDHLPRLRALLNAEVP